MHTQARLFHGSNFANGQLTMKLDLSKISCYTVLGFIIYLELAEMGVQKEEVWRLEKELSEAEETLENERAKSKGKL